MGLFEKGLYLDPKYDFLNKYVSIMYRGMWTPAKYEQNIREVDVPYYEQRLNSVDQEVIKRSILSVAIVEDKVKVYWPTIVFDMPHTIIGDVGSLFGQSETTHRRSYHSLIENLRIDTSNLEQYPALKDRIEYLTKYLETDPNIRGRKRVLKKLILFTGLVERISLFTLFYILMSYSMKNKGLKNISALQESTAKEELCHYSFGIDLINIIKEEYPSLWDEYLQESVKENLEKAYLAELKLLNWIFEQGHPDHLSKEEVLNFLNNNFNQVSKDLGVDLTFEVDEKLYEEKNSWFDKLIYLMSEPDFFDAAVGGYASEKEEINYTELNF